MQQTYDSNVLCKREGWGATTLSDIADAAEEDRGDAAAAAAEADAAAAEADAADAAEEAADAAEEAEEGLSLKYCTFCTFGDLPYFLFSLSIA